MKKRDHSFKGDIKICQCCGSEYVKPSDTSVAQWIKSIACSRSCSGKMKPKPTFESKVSRFWSKVDKSHGLGPGGDCWEWRASCNIHGYGLLKFDGKGYMAHRLSFKFANGILDNNLYVLHSCDNPSCVNPNHLRQGTHKENMEDKVSRGRSNAPRGINHYAALLTEEQVREIRKDTRPCSFVAKEYDVSAGAINGIRMMQKWKHVS